MYYGSRMPKVWFVTGASGGLGRAIAEAAAAADDVVIAAVRRPESVADLVAAYPGLVHPVSLDVADVPSIDAVVACAIARHGQIDILVNNAGRSLIGAAEETSDDALRSLFEVHFFGPVALTRAVLPGMRERGTGAIVQISSMGGRMSFAGVSAYSATKFALEGYSEALHAEVAPLGLTVLIVEPGNFRTGLLTTSDYAEALPAYEATVGATRKMIRDNDGRQVGDPARAAAAIRAALAAPQPPLHLALGADAVDAIRASTESVAAELAAWEDVARNTAYQET
jgi:NAD(P)-dependent dehydrogenase (short-subunit alcohol dehydrogenase family)